MSTIYKRVHIGKKYINNSEFFKKNFPKTITNCGAIVIPRMSLNSLDIIFILVINVIIRQFLSPVYSLEMLIFLFGVRHQFCPDGFPKNKKVPIAINATDTTGITAKATTAAAAAPTSPARPETIPAAPTFIKAAAEAMAPAPPTPASIPPTTLRVVPFALLRRLLGSVFLSLGLIFKLLSFLAPFSLR